MPVSVGKVGRQSLSFIPDGVGDAPFNGLVCREVEVARSLAAIIPPLESLVA